MTSARYLGHVTLPDGCDWLKSAANFPPSIDQTLLLPLTVVYDYGSHNYSRRAERSWHT